MMVQGKTFYFSLAFWSCYSESKGRETGVICRGHTIKPIEFYCHHLWYVGDKSYHKTLFIMFGSQTMLSGINKSLVLFPAPSLKATQVAKIIQHQITSYYIFWFYDVTDPMPNCDLSWHLNRGCSPRQLAAMLTSWHIENDVQPVQS